MWHVRGAGSYGYCEPDLVTFNTLISACAKAGKYEQALQVWLCPNEDLTDVSPAYALCSVGSFPTCADHSQVASFVCWHADMP